MTRFCFFLCEGAGIIHSGDHHSDATGLWKRLRRDAVPRTLAMEMISIASVKSA